MKSRKPSIPYIIWMAVFTMIPMIMVGITAFTGKNGGYLEGCASVHRGY